MSTGLESGLADLLSEDAALKGALRIQGLAMLLRDDGPGEASIEHDAEEAAFNEALDAIAAKMNIIVASCDALAADPTNDPGQPGLDRIFAECQKLSELNTTLCKSRRWDSSPFQELWKHAGSRHADNRAAQCKEVLVQLQDWLYEIALSAKRLDEELNGKSTDIGRGYHTNIPLLDPKRVIEGPADLDGILEEHRDSGITPFIATMSDFEFFIRTLFIERFGRFNANDRTMVALRTKLKSTARLCVCDTTSTESECVILPLSISQTFYAPYSNTDKRWLMDTGFLSSRTIAQLIKRAGKHSV